jgi:hypothetical protein
MPKRFTLKGIHRYLYLLLEALRDYQKCQFLKLPLQLSQGHSSRHCRPVVPMFDAISRSMGQTAAWIFVKRSVAHPRYLHLPSS